MHKFGAPDQPSVDFVEADFPLVLNLLVAALFVAVVAVAITAAAAASVAIGVLPLSASQSMQTARNQKRNQPVQQ